MTSVVSVQTHCNALTDSAKEGLEIVDQNSSSRAFVRVLNLCEISRIIKLYRPVVGPLA